MKIKIVLEPGAKLPVRSTEGAAAWDVFANIKEPMVIYPNTDLNMGGSGLESTKPFMVPTGVRVQLPKGYYWDLRIRSGLSTNHALILANGCGVIDEDYRGIVCVPVINESNYAYTIQPGEKIAQVILQKYYEQEFEVVDQLDSTERGTGGFGHTGRT